MKKDKIDKACCMIHNEKAWCMIHNEKREYTQAPVLMGLLHDWAVYLIV